MPNTYACKLVSNPNVPIFLPRVCTLVLFIMLAAAKQLAETGALLSILRAFHESYIHSTGPGTGPGPGSIIIGCKN